MVRLPGNGKEDHTRAHALSRSAEHRSGHGEPAKITFQDGPGANSRQERPTYGRRSKRGPCLRRLVDGHRSVSAISHWRRHRLRRAGSECSGRSNTMSFPPFWSWAALARQTTAAQAAAGRKPPLPISTASWPPAPMVPTSAFALPVDEDGLASSDTATLRFDNVRVPAAHLIGEENAGFPLLSRNFNDERLGLAASSIAFARLAYEHALERARTRITFGKPLFEHQVIRHKLVDMFQRVTASQALLELTAWRMDQGEMPVAELCALKNQATQALAFCASEGVQIFGGAGFLRGNVLERIYREVKVNAIGGGGEEIMKELAAKHLDPARS